jgi:hypothetical protein
MAILSSQRMIIWLLSVPGPFHVSIKLGASEWWKYRTSILTCHNQEGTGEDRV